jgi:hypothetical protein
LTNHEQLGLQYFAQFADVQKSLDQEYRRQNRHLAQLKAQKQKMDDYHDDKEKADERRIEAEKKHNKVAAEELSASKKNDGLVFALEDKRKELKIYKGDKNRGIDGDLAKKEKNLKLIEDGKLEQETLADKTMALEIFRLRERIKTVKTTRCVDKISIVF